MKFAEWGTQSNMDTLNSNHDKSQSCNFTNVTGDAQPFLPSRASKRILDQDEQYKKNQPSQLQSLCKAFQTKICSLNSPFHKLDQDGFCKILKSFEYYKSNLQDPETSKWCIECGESSKTYLPITEAAKERLVCYVHSKEQKIVGKFVVFNAERKLIVPRMTIDKNRNLDLLMNMHQLTKATIKDRYQPPTNHTKLSDVKEVTVCRLQMYAVVTAINKLPTRTKSSWHSLICISDPSLLEIDMDEEKDSPPGEFKMHLFLPLLEDHPEFHRGDIVRFTNVKIEAHQMRCDGRVFSKTDITVYCHPDSKVPVLRENVEERSAVIRLLSQWWTLNHRFFDSLTPHPIYHLLSRYPGIRSFKELSDQLVCDLYCQVVSMSTDSSDLNFLCVRDGTIFTLEKNNPTPDFDNLTSVAIPSERPTFGFLGLIIFEPIPWRRIKALKIGVNDYVFLKDVKVVFLTDETLNNLPSFYTYRHPCVLLRPTAEGVKKVDASHHEACKIRSRLHRLPEELDKMDNWKFPEPIEEEHQEDPLVVRLNNSTVQMNLLKRLKRS